MTSYDALAKGMAESMFIIANSGNDSEYREAGEVFRNAYNELLAIANAVQAARGDG